MKQKLIEHYGDGIVISSDDGKSDVVTLGETAEKIWASATKNQKRVT